jgi:MoxR-like ATPase
MQEYQVTIERETYQLSRPFMVIAAQQETGAEGTYLLTNVQGDRFLLRSLSQYSSREEEMEVIANIDQIDDAEIQAVTSLEEIGRVQEIARRVYVSGEIVEYITLLVESLRADPDVDSGPSIRAGIALYKCSRVMALLDGRDFVIPDDIKYLAFPAVEHRLKVRPEAEMDDVTPQIIVERALEKTPVPKIKV